MRARAAPGWIAFLAVLATVALAGESAAHPTPRPGEQTGVASWYGEPHHGRRTASGDVYDQEALTAAHPSLPFGSVIRVTNLANGRSIEVRVNDRGPVIAGRIVDLSRAAARLLDALGAGLVRVHLRVMSLPGVTLPAARASAGTP